MRQIDSETMLSLLVHINEVDVNLATNYVPILIQKIRKQYIICMYFCEQ